VIIPPFFFFWAITIPAVLTLGFWFIGQFFNGLFSLGTMTAAYSGGVAWWAHVGGFLVGVIVAMRLPKRPSTPQFPQPRTIYYYYP
jgi:membrane associated rhomboid family serine protease